MAAVSAMKLVIAPDSFKESLSAAEVAAAIARGWKSVYADAQLVLLPMADGGEGTLDVVLAARPGRRMYCRVSNALGETVDAAWGLLEDGTALLEMATASGLESIPRERRDALQASSYGTGELIRAALDAGAQRIILALGGSACTDAGAGMLQALGASLRNAHGSELSRGGAALQALAQIDLATLDSRLQAEPLQVAVDVQNSLCGAQGAAHVFGPQKGASAEQVQILDAALTHFAVLAAGKLGEDFSALAGAGAAGGVGFAAKAFLHAEFHSGVDLLAKLSGLEQALVGADLLITGEGQLDAQSSQGKTPVGVARIARAAGVPVLALAGRLAAGYQRLYAEGIGAAFSLACGPMTLEQSCASAAAELEQRSADLARLWQMAQAAR